MQDVSVSEDISKAKHCPVSTITTKVIAESPGHVLCINEKLLPIQKTVVGRKKLDKM